METTLCANCNGTGEIEAGVKCPDCNGAGTIEEPKDVSLGNG